MRDETGGSTTNRAGRFDTIEALKTAQETIVQMSHNPGVVAAALAAAGPENGEQTLEDWPTDADVEGLQGAITVSPPKGSEFGRNEVLFLAVTAPTKDAQSPWQRRFVISSSGRCSRFDRRKHKA